MRWLAIGLLTVAGLYGQSEADLRLYEEYRQWVTRQPVHVQRAGDMLASQGVLDANARIDSLRAYGRKAEVGRWNRALKAEKPTFNLAPNAFLVEMTTGRKRGRALDVGMGQGRNAIWLAQQGWDVTGFDQDERAVAKAIETAKQLGVRVAAEIKGSEEFAFGSEQWDPIVLSYVSFREQAAAIKRSPRPGGIVVIEGFHRDATKGTSIGGGVVFDTAEIPTLFRELRVVRYQEPVTVADFGKQAMRVVQYCAEKAGE